VKFSRAETLRRFFDMILPEVAPAPSAAAVLEVFASLDSDVDRLNERLARNPALGERWDRHVEKARSAEVPRRQAFVLLGMENTRDFLVTGGGKAAYGRAAQTAREVLSKEKDSAPELAYAAGVIFDAFAAGAARWIAEPIERKTYLTELDRVAAHGLQAARVAHGLARGISGLSGARLAFAGGLLHDVGKVALTALDPGYAEFRKHAEEKALSRRIRQFAEAERYGLTHAELGSLVCAAHPLFAPLARAVRFHHDPHLLRGDDRSAFRLAAILSVASNMARLNKKAENDKDPLIAEWKGPELKGEDAASLGFQAKALVKLSAPPV